MVPRVTIPFPFPVASFGAPKIGNFSFSIGALNLNENEKEKEEKKWKKRMDKKVATNMCSALLVWLCAFCLIKREPFSDILTIVILLLAYYLWPSQRRPISRWASFGQKTSFRKESKQSSHKCILLLGPRWPSKQTNKQTDKQTRDTLKH